MSPRGESPLAPVESVGTWRSTSSSWLQRLLKIAVGVYGVALIAATHWPRLEAPSIWSPLLPPDKTLHLAAYAVLAALTMTAVVVCPSDSRPRLWQVMLGLAAFALIDEITQPLVSRAAEQLDFVADCAGILLGILLAIGIARLASRLRPPLPGSGSCPSGSCRS